MQVQFTYTKAVTCPLHLVGEKGQTRDLPQADAQRLQREGWGRIKSEDKIQEPGARRKKKHPSANREP